MRRRTLPASTAARTSFCTPKVNDPCPTTVIEALACGVPVAYAASGGTVELVADEAGIGVPHPDGYERDEPRHRTPWRPPSPACWRIVERFSAAARRRAVERYGLADWLDRHAEIFDSLVA